MPLNRRWGYLGDSITNSSSATNATYAFPRQSLDVAGNLHNPPSLRTVSGVPGNTSAQMLARTAANIPAANIDGLVIFAGANDAATANAVPVATYAANIAAIIALYPGKQIIICTPPPRGPAASPTADEKQRLIDYRAWILANAASLGAKVADVYTALDDGTGTLKANCDSGDGIHPNNLGHFQIAKAVGAQIFAWQAPRTSLVAALAANNLITNGLVSGPLGAGDPTGWVAGTPGSQTFGTASVRSIVAAPAGGAGQAYRIDITAAVASKVRRRATVTGFATGDKLLYVARALITDVSGDFETAWAVSPGSVEAVTKLTNLSAGTDLGGPGSSGVLSREMANTYTVASGVTSIGLQVQVYIPAGSRYQADFYELGVFNLTALGLASSILV